MYMIWQRVDIDDDDHDDDDDDGHGLVVRTSLLEFGWPAKKNHI